MYACRVRTTPSVARDGNAVLIEAPLDAAQCMPTGGEVAALTDAIKFARDAIRTTPLSSGLFPAGCRAFPQIIAPKGALEVFICRSGARVPPTDACAACRASRIEIINIMIAAARCLGANTVDSATPNWLDAK